MYTTGIQQPQYQTNVPINLQTIPNYQAPPPQPIQYQNVVYQTHTDHVIHSRAPRNIIVQWIPQRKLYHSGFDSHYPLDLSQHMDINEFANLIRECTVRFRQVAQPWRVFWKKQKKMMPVEIVAAVATFCLSMFVSIPLWHRGYGKAMKRAEYEEANFRVWLRELNHNSHLPRGFQIKLSRPNSKRYHSARYELENIELVFEFM